MNSRTEVAPGVPAQRSEYVLATGVRAVQRLVMLHEIYAPAGQRVLLKAGLKRGMRAADFGCGIGATTRMLAELVGPEGSVTGVDGSAAQLEQAAKMCVQAGYSNIFWTKADACATELPGGTFDLVYCRFLLIHLPDPIACLREMRRLLKPGGIIVVEDGDISTGGSIPPTALDEFGALFRHLGPKKGVDYLLGRDLYHLAVRAGFADANIEIHQPAYPRGENRVFLKWSIEEAGQGCVDAGLLSAEQLRRTLDDMQAAIDDPGILVLMPRMSLVWAHKES